MTFEELIKYNKSEVRSNSNLTLYFINAYEFLFGFKPSCSGCSINKEFEKLKKEVLKRNILELEIEIKQQIINNMEQTKTFVRSASLTEDMLAYKDKNGVIRRKFVNKLTDEFVIAYLTNGTEQELEVRKKKFKVLPLAMTETKKDLVIEENKEIVQKKVQKRKRKNK